MLDRISDIIYLGLDWIHTTWDHCGMFGSCQSLDQKQLDKGINYPFISRDEREESDAEPGDTDLKNGSGQDVVN